MLARLDEAGQRGIDRRDAPGMPRQQDAVAMAHQHHHGRRDARIGAMTTGRAAQAELARHALGRRAAGAAIAVRARPLGDLIGATGLGHAVIVQHAEQAAQLAERVALRRFDIGRRAAARRDPAIPVAAPAAAGPDPRTPARRAIRRSLPRPAIHHGENEVHSRPLYGVADAGILFTWQAGFDANRMHASRAGQFARTASARAVGRALRTMC